MNLTPGTTINSGDRVTRQTIYDLVANAGGGAVQASDLSAEVQSIMSQSEAPTPAPGKLWWDLTDRLMKVYVDVLDGTGVSVWLAIGPDRFDTVCYATESIPFGAAVQPAGTGRRHVKLPPDPLSLKALVWQTGIWEPWKCIGHNQNGPRLTAPTVPSGSFFACGIDGIMWAWMPCKKNFQATRWAAMDPAYMYYTTLISGISGMSSDSGISNVRGGVISNENASIQRGTTNNMGHAIRHCFSNALDGYWAKVMWTGVHTGRL